MVIKVKYHHSDSGNCQTTFKQIDKVKYFNRSDDGHWYTTNPYEGYWENGYSVSPDVTFQIVDKEENILFEESNAKKSDMLPIDIVAREKGNQIAAQYNLKTWNKWKKWLLSEKVKYEFTDYDNNWCFGSVTEIIKKVKLEKFNYLGIPFAVVVTYRKHKICNKEWIQFDILRDEKFGDCEAVCGFQFEEGIK